LAVPLGVSWRYYYELAALPAATSDDSLKIDAVAALVSDAETIVLKLAPHLVASDAELRSLAGRIFQAAPVRSVTIDRERTAAVVRLRPGATVVRAEDVFGQPASALVGDLQSAGAALPVDHIDFVSWTDPRDGSTSFIKMPERVRGWRKAVYLMLAGAALALGLLGIVLPGLPTTPFVLLGSFFLVRSSRRLHERLLTSRLFGGVLRDWYLHRGLRPHVRARAVAVVALVMAVSLAVARPAMPVTLTIVALAACGLFVIWRLPSVRVTDGR
jgi:uncharacterized membrane protein YbaN (DUF454 family)